MYIKRVSACGHICDWTYGCITEPWPLRSFLVSGEEMDGRGLAAACAGWQFGVVLGSTFGSNPDAHVY